MKFTWLEVEDDVITGWFYPANRSEFKEFLQELRTYCRSHKIPIIKPAIKEGNAPKIREEFYGSEFRVVIDDKNDLRHLYYKDIYDGKIETIYKEDIT